MLRSAVLLSLIVLVAAAPGVAAPPKQGLLVPGRSLGGIELGSTRAQVRSAWGTRFGRCRGCADPTWYFNLRRFQPAGAGVEFVNDRVAGVFTIWSPPGWRTTRGLRLGESSARITAVYGPLKRLSCNETLSVLTLPRGSAHTLFYVVDDQLWGFGLTRPDVPACR